MNYPLLSEYITSLKDAEDNLDKYNNLRLIIGSDGYPMMSSGNFAAVFKMQDENGNFFALKCFLKDQPNRNESYKKIAEELEFASSNFLIKFKYLEKELFVYSKNCKENEFPVLIMDWVEGTTLDNYIRENISDTYKLDTLSYQFSRLSIWLASQPFAHGDLKPDNIMVREDGSLVLIDYDGMFVPSMQGEKSRELGTPDFRHPLRTEDMFDEHIDDFALASILLSLKAIALQPDLLDKYGAKDRLLLSTADYRNISECKILKEIYPSSNQDLNKLIALFTLALTQTNLANVSYQLFNIPKPKEQKKKIIKNISTKVTEEELKEAWKDEFGAKYSKNKKKLLDVPWDIEEYNIRPGTLVIGDKAFHGCESLKSVAIPRYSDWKLVFRSSSFSEIGCYP